MKLKMRATRIRLDRGGYTRKGKYYGIGTPLYEVEAEYEGNFEGKHHQFYLVEMVRANSVKEAKAKVLKEHPLPMEGRTWHRGWR